MSSIHIQGQLIYKNSQVPTIVAVINRTRKIWDGSVECVHVRS